MKGFKNNVKLAACKMFDIPVICGEVELILYDKQAHIKTIRKQTNIIVANGLAHIASRMLGTAQAVMGWIEVGTGVTAEVVADTTLQTAVAGSRTATTPTNVTTTQTNDTVQHVATLGAGVGTGAITEAGIFNAASAGIMLNRVTFAVVNKLSTDSLTITWKIKIA